MERYDYLNAMIDDVLEYLEDLSDEELEDVNEERLYDDLWAEDSVTGNGSGSYWFSDYKAREALFDNNDLFMEAANSFDEPLDTYVQSPEAADVTIRCYLLGEAIDRALNIFYGRDKD